MRRLIPVLCLSVLACSDQGLGRATIELVAYTAGQAYASFDDQTDTINLGQVPVYGTRWAVFRASNDTEAVLTIDSVLYTETHGTLWKPARWIAPGNAEHASLPFVSGGEGFPATVAARREILIGVPYASESEGGHSAKAEIHSNAANAPGGVTIATVTADAIYTGEPNIQIENAGYTGPNEATDCFDIDTDGIIDGCRVPLGHPLDFGNISIGQTGSVRLAISNAGECTAYPGVDPCSLCNLSIRPDPTRESLGLGFGPGTNDQGYFRFAQPISSPLDIGQRYVGEACTAPGEAVLTLEFDAPAAPGEYFTTIVVESNDPDEPLIEIPVRAESRSAPIAVAELDETRTDPTSIPPYNCVYFDGLDSYDPEDPTNPDAVVSYLWEIIEQPDGADPGELDPQGFGARQFSFFIPIAGDYAVELTVWNQSGVRSGDTASSRVELTSMPEEDLHIHLVWDHESNDQDLHLVFLDQDPRVCNAVWDCYWRNCSDDAELDPPIWFASDPARRGANPSLDVDDTDGLGPENVNIDEPKPGTYRILVHYCGDAVPQSAATSNIVRVYVHGLLRGEYRRVLDARRQIWAVADVVWRADGAVDLVPYPSDVAGQQGAVDELEVCQTPGWAFP